MLTVAELFELAHVPDALRHLLEVDVPWGVLELLDEFGAQLQDERQAGSIHPTAVVEGPVLMGPGARIDPHAYVSGPLYMGAGAQVGHGARIRGPVVLADGAVVGHASEAKRSVLLPHAHAPHFNYVGDSVVGQRVNLGAGVKLANFKAGGSEVRVDGAGTGLRKLGAVLGDGVSIGCNAVLAPGTVVGKGTVIYSLASIRGVVPAGMIVKYSPEHGVVEATR